MQDTSRYDLSSRRQAEELLAFIRLSPTAWQAAQQLAGLLSQAGFRPYDSQMPMQSGDRCLVCHGSALFAFSVGQNPLDGGFRLVGAHNDSPGLLVKPNSVVLSEGCLKLSTEVYGGPLLHTWFDRPLALAGRVVLAGSRPLEPETRLVRLERPLLIIPNVAIHMNRTANDGTKVEPQKMLLPVIGLADNRPDKLLERLLAEALDVAPEAILDYDLFLHDTAPGTFLGLGDELIAAPRLDNLGLAYAAASALAGSDTKSGVSIVACFDHEEIGSQTRQGAQSLFLRDLLEKIVLSLGGSRRDFLGMLERSFLVSADQAHAVHPNFSEFADATSRPRINGGPVIKRAANRSYTSDAATAAAFQALCSQAGVPCQTFVNRSDLRGGSTVGPVLTEHLPIPSVDVGNPIWAMHSICETGGVADQAAMLAVLRTFFSQE